MEQSLLLIIIIIIGVCPAAPQLMKMFRFVSEPLLFEEAQQFCRQTYSDLASVESVEELWALDTEDLMSAGAWIGLRDDSPVLLWHWALADSRFYGDGEMNYRNWAKLNPGNFPLTDCATMTSGGQFQSSNCLETLNFICYDDLRVDRPYVYVSFLFTWRAAQSYCRYYYTDLVSVRNREENLRIQALIPSLAVAYIGLFRDGFIWSDGAASSLRNWDLLQPDAIGDCVAIQYDQSWKTELCGKAKPFFCHHNVVVSKRQILRLELKSGVNVNDPAMKTLLLSQMERRLQTLGVMNITTVEWREAADGTVFHKTSENQTKTSLQRKKR